MSEIIPNKLYLGDMFDANNKELIRDKQISCIICVADNLKLNHEENSKTKIYKYNLSDDYECDILSYFNEICDIIENEKVVLVNCAAGVSRSSTIVLAYIMKYYKNTLKEAFNYVREKRPRICPNKHFMNSLLAYELTLFNSNSLSYIECINLFYYT